MADTPIIFKRTKAKHVQRARDGSPEAPQQTTETNTNESSMSVLSTKLKNKTKRGSKPKTALSFGGDREEGEEVFKVKKSSLSRKLVLGQYPSSLGNLPSNLDQASISSRSGGGPIYDQAYLSELKAQTPGARASQPPAERHDVSMADVDPLEVNDTLGVSETTIPSESSILAAKAKRDRLRNVKHPDEDFISLFLTGQGDEYQGPHPESRLVREEDELGEGDDEFADFTSAQERIALGKKSKKVEASKRRDEMKELIEDAEEVDDEMEEWEQAQLRRGGMRAEEETALASVKQVYKAAPIPPLTPIPTLDSAVARLTQATTSLTQSHGQNTSTMTALSAEHNLLDERENEMRQLITKAELKRSWFAAFRDWIETVATFLEEKFPQLERLEEEQVSLFKERYDMVSGRRHADDLDDLSSFLGSLPVVPHTEDEELDELGRVVPRSNPTAARRDRQYARATRRSRRQGSGRRFTTESEDGYSTDASLPSSDAADYQLALEKLSQKRNDVLSDVRAGDFKDPNLGLSKWFGEWREQFGDIYTGAWGGLALVGAWEFWARLELIGWIPFESTHSLDSFRWYRALYEYARPQPRNTFEGAVKAELGPDGDLVSAMISTVVIPRLSMIIQGGGMDPYSAKDVRRVVDLAEEIGLSVEKNHIKFQVLLKAVCACFQRAVTEWEALTQQYLAQNNPSFDPEAIPARRRVLSRQRKLLTGLLTWRKYTGERFGLGVSAEKLVRDCMLPLAETGWEVGGESIMRTVGSMLPKELVPSPLKTRLRLI